MQSNDQRMMTAEYSSKNYREAMTKEQQCKVALEGWGEYQARRKEYQEYCPKSKSKSKSNFVFCPKKIIKRKKDEERKNIQRLNDYFKKFGKTSKKKKTWLDLVASKHFVVETADGRRTLAYP